MSKVIDEVVFKKSIEDMLQYLSDNCLYEFVPYDDTEISNLFSLTPEEAQKLSDLISDEVVSKYKLWSSSKVNDSLIAAKSECNDYTDKMLTNISSISIKYVDTLPTSDISTSTIYILKNTGGGNDTLNLYDDTDGTWAVIGDFTVSLDDYAKIQDVDSKLDEKANKTEVLLQDKIQTTTGAETHDNVYSAKLTKTELDKKANDDEVVKKTDIVTTIDNSSTNNKVPSASAIYFKSKNKITELYNSEDIIAYADSISKEVVMDTVRIMNGINCPYGVDNNDNDFYYTIYNIADDNFKRIVAYDIRKNDMYMIMKKNGVWGKWQRVCTTSVADVPLTNVTSFTSNYSSGYITYMVKNGICYVNVSNLRLTYTGTGITVCSGMPKPALEFVDTLAEAAGRVVGNIMIGVNGDVTSHYADGSSGLYCTFSYPVKE